MPISKIKGVWNGKVENYGSRARWIHGGGSGLKDPLAPRQEWVPTLGCIRAQNEDVEELCQISNEWTKNNPGKKIKYHRR